MALAPAAMVAKMLSSVGPPVAMMGILGYWARISATTSGRLAGSGHVDNGGAALNSALDILPFHNHSDHHRDLQQLVQLGDGLILSLGVDHNSNCALRFCGNRH